MKRCPKCDAITQAFGKAHCTATVCDWFNCLHCGTTYQRTQHVGFLDRGKAAWHTSMEATP